MIGWGFIGAGLFTWGAPARQQPRLADGRHRLRLVRGGLSGSDVPVLFSIGVFFGSLYVVTTIHTLLAAPQGTLEPGDRRIVKWAYLLVTVGILPLYVFYDPSHDCENCPDNVFMITDSQTAVNIAGTVVNLIGVVILVLVLRSLVRRWRRATRAERRLYAPMYAAGVALMIALIGQLALQSTFQQGNATAVAFVISLVPFALVPYLFLALVPACPAARGWRRDRSDEAPERDAARGPPARRAR